MTKQLKTLFLVSALAAAPQAHSIDLSGGKGLACEALVCAIGIAIPESHAECQEVLTRWSIYLSTLSPFSGKPKCPKVNDEGQVESEMEMQCSNIQDGQHREACESVTVPPGEYTCEELGTDQRFECENYCQNKTVRGGKIVCIVH